MPSNEQIYSRFYRWRYFHRTSNAAAPRSSFAVFPFILIISMLAVIAFGLSPLIIAGVLLVIVIYFVYMFYSKPARLFRSKPGAALQTEINIFTESGFNRLVRSEEAGMIDTANGSYSYFTKIVETSRDFYFFTSPTQAYLVDKECFTKGDAETLHKILQKVAEATFIYKGKKKVRK
jgi:hypothetical protein